MVDSQNKKTLVVPELTFDVDITAWPLVVITLPEVLTVVDLDAFFVWAPAMSHHGKYATLIDALAVDVASFSAAHRKCAADHFNRLNPLLKERLVCEAYIVSSRVARGVLTAVRWIAPLAWPSKSFSNVEEGTQFALQELKKAGVM